MSPQAPTPLSLLHFPGRKRRRGTGSRMEDVSWVRQPEVSELKAAPKRAHCHTSFYFLRKLRPRCNSFLNQSYFSTFKKQCFSWIVSSLSKKYSVDIAGPCLNTHGFCWTVLRQTELQQWLIPTSATTRQGNQISTCSKHCKTLSVVHIENQISNYEKYQRVCLKHSTESQAAGLRGNKYSRGGCL